MQIFDFVGLIKTLLNIKLHLKKIYEERFINKYAYRIFFELHNNLNTFFFNTIKQDNTKQTYKYKTIKK